MYKKVELKNGFVGMENEVAEMWKQKNIIKKNFEMNKGQRYFTFYDGPPTANGKPHVGHIETRVMKDIIPRYKGDTANIKWVQNEVDQAVVDEIISKAKDLL